MLVPASLDLWPRTANLRLSEQPLQVRLTLSLHGATDEVRQHIMPINRKYPKYPLAESLDACAVY